MFFFFSFFFIFFSIYLLFGCSMFGFLPTSERGQETPTFWPLLPCPEEKLRTFLFSIFFSNLVNLSLQVKDCRIFHWWKWKIGQPKTQGGVLFKEGHSEVLPKGLHRRAQTLQRQQWIRCTFINYLQFLIDVFFLLLFSIP